MYSSVALSRLTAAALLLASAGQALAQPSSCVTLDEGVFPGDGEIVRLVKAQGLKDSARAGVFRAPLAVNTDGAPNSYHPDDFLGLTKAINRIDNGVFIEKVGGGSVPLAEEIEVFDAWRDSGDWTVPAGYSVEWQNVIATTPEGTPCIFTQGEYAGYFGSLTALQNDLPASQSGECEADNQLDQRFIPAIVLRGDDNPLEAYGAQTGDLALAINPYDAAIEPVPAIVGDTGDGARIGEGSVALAMQLKGETRQPSTYEDVLDIDTDDRQMIIVVFPGSRLFELQRPYSARNIARRLESWARQEGYGTIAEMAALMQGCATGL